MPVEPAQHGTRALNRGNVPLPARHTLLSQAVELSNRDAAVVRLVGQFRQTTAAHIWQAVFPGLSRIPIDRCLERLVRLHYLRRLGRTTDGLKGGASAFVYGLGPAAWYYLDKPGRYKADSGVRQHAVAVSRIHADLLCAQRSGLLELIDCKVEQPVGRAQADLLVVIKTQVGRTRLFALEVETTRKRPAYLLDKCKNYNAAYHEQDGGVFPVVIFAVPHEWLARDVSAKMRAAQAPSELFRVTTFDGIVALLVAT
jgi:hypothetical protein